MTRLNKLRILLTASFAVQSSASAADHVNKHPTLIHLHPSYNCATFQLEGVAVADASVNNTNPWFSLSKSNPHYSELFSLLVTAKASGLSINVTTNGQSVCYNAEVTIIFLK